jgi:hypothetical protein
MAKEKDFFGAKKGSVLAGAGGLVVSVIGFLWAQAHAPGNISTALTGGWTLKEGPYYGIMALVLLVGIYGIVNLVRAIISQQKG